MLIVAALLIRCILVKWCQRYSTQCKHNESVILKKGIEALLSLLAAVSTCCARASDSGRIFASHAHNRRCAKSDEVLSVNVDGTHVAFALKPTSPLLKPLVADRIQGSKASATSAASTAEQHITFYTVRHINAIVQAMHRAGAFLSL